MFAEVDFWSWPGWTAVGALGQCLAAALTALVVYLSMGALKAAARQTEAAETMAQLEKERTEREARLQFKPALEVARHEALTRDAVRLYMVNHGAPCRVTEIERIVGPDELVALCDPAKLIPTGGEFEVLFKTARGSDLPSGVQVKLICVDGMNKQHTETVRLISVLDGFAKIPAA